jgi:hypothetical protein
MFSTILSTVIPMGFLRSRRRSPSEKYALHVAQTAVRHHYDSLCLALGVLEHLESPVEQAEWLNRLIHDSEKCALAVDDCMAKSE